MQAVSALDKSVASTAVDLILLNLNQESCKDVTSFLLPCPSANRTENVRSTYVITPFFCQFVRLLTSRTHIALEFCGASRVFIPNIYFNYMK